MKELTGKYLVDLIEWRGGITELSDGTRLPSEHWFDVDMNEEFWYEHVGKHLNEDNNPREALNDFLWEYLDKVFGIEPIHYRIRNLSEIRDNRIDDLIE